MRVESHDCPWPSGIPGLFQWHKRHERRDAAEHRQRILEVAQRLFAEHGVDAVSMHQIAMAAGIGQGTLYRRYAHKGELCMDLLHEHYERFVEEIATLLAARAISPALERLDSVLAKCVALLEEHGALLGPAAGTDEQCSESDISRHFSFQGSPWYLWLQELFAGLLTEAVERGEINSLDVPYTTDAILATLHPMFYSFQRKEHGFSSERILQGLRHIYINGLKAPSTITGKDLTESSPEQKRNSNRNRSSVYAPLRTDAISTPLSRLGQGQFGEMPAPVAQVGDFDALQTEQDR